MSKPANIAASKCSFSTSHSVSSISARAAPSKRGFALEGDSAIANPPLRQPGFGASTRFRNAVARTSDSHT